MIVVAIAAFGRMVYPRWYGDSPDAHEDHEPGAISG